MPGGVGLGSARGYWPLRLQDSGWAAYLEPSGITRHPLHAPRTGTCSHRVCCVHSRAGAPFSRQGSECDLVFPWPRGSHLGLGPSARSRTSEQVQQENLASSWGWEGGQCGALAWGWGSGTALGMRQPPPPECGCSPQSSCIRGNRISFTAT